MIAEDLQKRLAGEARVVFDVGAERGRYALRYLEMFPQATVYAFEPAPVALSVLDELAANEPRLKVVPAAVMDRVGEVVLNISSADVYSSVLDMIPGWTEHRMVTKVTVPAITLDDYCEQEGIETVDVLKIDTQGTEMAVLIGAAGLLEKGVKVILCEMEYMERYVGQCWHYEVEAFLSFYGYHSKKTIQSFQDGRLLRADGVFAR